MEPHPSAPPSSARSFLAIGVAVVGVLAVICTLSLIALSAGGAYFYLQSATPGALNLSAEQPPTPRPDAVGSSMGNPNAKVTVMIFEDFQCPICQRFDQQITPQIVTQYVDTGKVRLDYRHLIVIDGNLGGTESRDAALASECAAEQGQFWAYHDLLFANQTGEHVGDYTISKLKKYAGTLQLDQKKFDTCLDGKKYQNILDEDLAAALKIRANGTPTVYIAGQPLIAGIPRDGFPAYERLIEAALAAAGVK